MEFSLFNRSISTSYPQAHISATARRTRTDWLARVLRRQPPA
ncbi:hypothetical protein OH738_14025 [Streptomyces hirsutus]|nr:hypothetical protein OH738_14025 [Streptomyces hirsutus]